MKLYKRIKTKIIESNLARFLDSLVKIKDLKANVEELDKTIRETNDLLLITRSERDNYKTIADKLPIYEYSLNKSCELLKEQIKLNKEQQEEYENKRIEYENKIFDLDLQVKGCKVQIDEYKLEIEDLKSDRYLIKKVKSGRTPNTNKTKISKPMSTRVTKYMRGEHE